MIRIQLVAYSLAYAAYRYSCFLRRPNQAKNDKVSPLTDAITWHVVYVASMMLDDQYGRLFINEQRSLNNPIKQITHFEWSLFLTHM